jgi:NhaP-type Na+/H+ or K+/H+ antiporter
MESGIMATFFAVLLIVSLTLLALGSTAGLVNNRLWISEPLVCLSIGVLAGPHGFEWVNLHGESSAGDRIMIEAARVALAIAVVGAAIRLPRGYLRTAWRELAWILGAGMTLMALAGAVLAWALLDWKLLPALLLGAILAPTDPVLAAPIVTGKIADRLVPPRLRFSITAESGSNDGLALVLILLPATLLSQPNQPGAIGTWFMQAWLYEFVLGVAFGMTIGWLAGHIFAWAERQRDAERPSLITVAIALALIAVAASELLGTDGILACFAAGAMFNRQLHGESEKKQERFNEAVSRLLELPFFVVLGILLPLDEWMALGGAALAFAFAVILLRRPLPWMLLRGRLPSLHDWRDVAFAGWFGPVGIAAVFYALDWRQRTGVHDLWPVVSLVVAVSVVLHGLSGTSMIRALYRRPGQEQRSP